MTLFAGGGGGGGGAGGGGGGGGKKRRRDDAAAALPVSARARQAMPTYVRGERDDPRVSGGPARARECVRDPPPAARLPAALDGQEGEGGGAAE